MFALLDISQQQELMQYVLAQKQGGNPDTSLRSISSQVIPTTSIVKLTEIQAENLYFCLENRLVYICETEIMLTVKEFDIFALLIMNPRRVLTYEMIIDLVWHENLDYYSHRAINNHVSNLRHKLKVTPETPDYIRSVHSIGYKFNPNIELL
ncbi:response regulator transcription factor [Pseudoflavonifractor sp. 60]|uniref:winged helix-turn-helix domain-containing protein n=1 Tax=Pseudoflavonifractor sp. 60 TaxID=2304576 RepID=UPI001FABD2C2|nr:response regulator transcription factor [Pseudoflavonifractor sp. 60]